MLTRRGSLVYIKFNRSSGKQKMDANIQQLTLSIREACEDEGYPSEDIVKIALRRVSAEDWESNPQTEKWVEFHLRRPGELEDSPHLVFCTRDQQRKDSYPDRDWRPL